MELEEDKKARLIGLCVACPHLLPLTECPLNNIREEPLRNRVDTISDMTVSQAEDFLVYHAECTDIRSNV